MKEEWIWVVGRALHEALDRFSPLSSCCPSSPWSVAQLTEPCDNYTSSHSTSPSAKVQVLEMPGDSFSRQLAGSCCCSAASLFCREGIFWFVKLVATADPWMLLEPLNAALFGKGLRKPKNHFVALRYRTPSASTPKEWLCALVALHLK